MRVILNRNRRLPQELEHRGRKRVARYSIFARLIDTINLFSYHQVMLLSNLSVFAEVSIALLGFSGLASALSSVSAKNRAFITIRMRALLIVSGGSCFGSLAPMTGLDLYYCSVLLALLTAGTVYKIARDFLNAEDVSPSPLLVFITVGWAIAGTSFLTYALTLDPDLIPVAYIFTLSGTITVAILFFIRFVLAIVQDLE